MSNKKTTQTNAIKGVTTAGGSMPKMKPIRNVVAVPPPKPKNK